MATLYKHGAEIGRLEYLTYNVAVMADGKLLRNRGDGWKLWRKCKDGINPADAFAARKAAVTRKEQECPTYAWYKHELHAKFPLKTRFLAHTVITSMPQDPDGCWSEFNDMVGHSIDLDTVVSLCRAWQSAEMEVKEYRARLAAENAEPVT